MNIKKYLFLFSFIFLNINFLKINCHQNQDSFLLANNYYNSGQYLKAYEEYLKISDQDKNYQVYYNLGNSAYKLNNYAKALIFWRRSEKKWPIFKGRTDLLQKIFLLKKDILLNNNLSDNLFFKMKRYFFSLLRTTPIIIFQIKFLFLWFLLFFYLNYFYQKNKKILIFILFILIAFSGILLALRYKFDFRNYGVVVSKEVSVYSGPGKNFQNIGILPEAAEVLIKKELDHFYNVKFNKQIGWVENKDVEKI